MRFTAFLVAAVTLAGAAHAKEGRVIACFQEVTVPAKYQVSKTMIEKAKRQYVRRNGRVELVEYPPVYKEHRTLVEPAHKVMQEIPCD